MMRMQKRRLDEKSADAMVSPLNGKGPLVSPFP